MPTLIHNECGWSDVEQIHAETIVNTIYRRIEFLI